MSTTSTTIDERITPPKEERPVITIARGPGEADAQAGHDQDEDRPDDVQEHGDGTSTTGVDIRAVSRRKGVRSDRPPVSHGPSIFAGQLGDQPIVKLGQALDDHLGLAQHGHEVGVAVPPRDDVPVEMAGQAGAGRLAEVQPDIVTLRDAASDRGSRSRGGPSPGARSGPGLRVPPACPGGSAGATRR